MEAENKMRKVQNYKRLELLKYVIIREINLKMDKKCAA